MPSPNPFDVIVAVLREKESILVVTHIYPDGDALGSQLGLGEILKGLGKKVSYHSEERVSHMYNFIPGSEVLAIEEAVLDEVECVVAVDCGDSFRLGRDMETLLRIHPFIVIDHHVGHKDFGDMRWVEPRRASTAEMIYELALALGADISFKAAYCLYTAIVSDTGSFKYDSTSARTFQVAGDLIARGVKPYEVAGKLFDNYSLSRLQLLEEVLASLEIHAGGRIAIITVTQQMFTETGATKDDTEDFINYPRALSSVQVAIFLKETREELVSVSMRAKGDCDVAAIAMKFGGGGHRNAAGFRLENRNINDVRTELLREVKQVLG